MTHTSCHLDREYWRGVGADDAALWRDVMDMDLLRDCWVLGRSHKDLCHSNSSRSWFNMRQGEHLRKMG